MIAGMNSESRPSSDCSVWLPLMLLACGIGFRAWKLHLGAADCCPGVAPWMAMAFTGAVVFPRALPWWVWPAAMLGTDLLMQGGRSLEVLSGMWLVYVCWAAAAVWGGRLRPKAGVFGTLGGAIVCSLGFYLITSTQAWLANPIYAKTLAGWAQALTFGDPAWSPPAYVFMLRSLMSDIGLSLLLLAAYNGEALMRSLRPLPLMRTRSAAPAGA